MNVPSTAEYQRHRTNTLRGIERKRILEQARELMRFNQANKHHYTREQINALRNGIGGTDGYHGK